MICDNCGHDSPRRRVRFVLMLRREWPVIELSRLCKRCRRELGIGAANHVLVVLVGLVALATVAAAGFGIVCLIQWLLHNGSTL